ncbi:protein maternal effect lethal 26-like [Schistocerca cancellata]|uniref:protein maternal effect lethal 26-like n=1 Tax=Schistocerca cancellata TaxID=274614 RepID=UPI0021190CD6|nr:protein maternal effect lethal 26-like [Schistocerca cancellata]
MAAREEVELGDLLDAGDGAVVTLVAGETRLAAHRAVLEKRSPVFRSMLGSNDAEVNVENVEGAVLRQLLSYAYTLRVPQQVCSVAPQLLAAADTYQLSDLKDACERRAVAELALENAAALGVLALRHSCPRLRQAAVALIKDNPRKVMMSQSWEDTKARYPHHLVDLMALIMESPAEKSPPATTGGGPTPANPRRARGRRGRTAPAAAPPAAAPHAPPPPGDAATSRLRSLSAEERDRRLVQAAEEGAVGELRALIAAGADVGATVWGWTALHWAAEVAAALLVAGADRGATDGKGRTALDLARRHNHRRLVEMLS